MKRAQAEVLTVVIELILASAFVYLMATAVDRAKEDKLPLQIYAARELSYAREAIDLFAQTNVLYDLVIPGDSFSAPTSFSNGIIRVGDARATYEPDKGIYEHPFASTAPNTVAIEMAGGAVRAGPEVKKGTGKNLVPCNTAIIPTPIALAPTSRETQALATKLAARNPQRFVKATDSAENPPKLKQEVIAAAGSLLILTNTADSKLIALTNKEGATLGCKSLNAVAPRPSLNEPSIPAAVIPLSEFEAPQSIAALLPAGKPAAILTIGNNYLANADEKLSQALS